MNTDPNAGSLESLRQERADLAAGNTPAQLPPAIVAAGLRELDRHIERLENS